MDETTRRFVRLLVTRLPEHADLIRAPYHDAIDVELHAATTPEKPRLAPRRPPVVPSGDMTVSDLDKQRARRALGRHGIVVRDDG